MDEAKSLVSMSLQAIFAALILAVAVGLIGTGYKLWEYFSRQDAANQEAAEYAEFAAYDNTTLRGQEVVELLSRTARESDLFVIIYEDSRSDAHDIDHCVVNKVLACYPGQSAYTKNFNFTKMTHYSKSTGVTLGKLYAKAINDAKSPLSTFNSGGIQKLDVSYSDLVKIFTTSMQGTNADVTQPLGQKVKDTINDTEIESGAYAQFKSAVVYSPDQSHEVVGVLLCKYNNTL